MRDALTDRRWGRVVTVLAVCLVAVCAGLLVPSRPSLAIGLAALLLVAGFILSAPGLLLAAVFAVPFAFWRVGPSSLQMSITDAVTLLAMLAALRYVPWHKRALRQILAGLAMYLGILGVVVLSHPTQKAAFELFHRAVLFGGTALIGAAVANRHQIAAALKALVFASAIVALGAIFDTLTHGLLPAYPFGINKNLAGSLLAFTVILLTVAPGRVEIRWSMIRYIRVLCIVGLAATQCRGAGLALVATIALYAIRHRSVRRRSPIFFFTVSLALIALSVVTLNSEYVNNPKFNAIDSRSIDFDNAINNVWLAHPITGGGLRWFQAGDSGSYVTAGVHNIVLAELSEGGLIALAALIMLLANTIRVLRRRRDPLGEAAFLIFVCEILFGMTDIFWVAGPVSLAMLIVGLAVGEDVERVTPHAAPALSAPTS